MEVLHVRSITVYAGPIIDFTRVPVVHVLVSDVLAQSPLYMPTKTYFNDETGSTHWAPVSHL